jgi:hypothetical protein
MTRVILAGQGLYYVATAVWSLVSIGTFHAVTGPKVDTWLVKTVGALVGVMGVVMLIGALRKRPAAESVVLATGSALALAAVDTWYAAKGRISRIYLADAVEELAAALLLLVTFRRTRP